MYYEYSLYAVPTILAAGLAAWLYLKIRQADKTRIRTLLLGTAAAILIALLTPVTARLIHQRAALPAMALLAAAFAVLAIAAALVLFLVHIIVTGKQKEAEEKEPAYRPAPGDAAAESAATLEGLHAPADAPAAGLQNPAGIGFGEPRVTPDQVYEGMPVSAETTQDKQPIMPGGLYAGETAHAETPEDMQAMAETYREETYEDLRILPGEPSVEPQAPSETPETGAEMVDTVRIIDKIGVDNVDDLLNSAMEFKMGGNYPGAVSCYRRALEQIQDKELLAWVVVDLCALAKIMKDDSIIREVLDSRPARMLDRRIIDEILNNI